MARKSMVIKQQKKQKKYSTREYNRCKICGRPHAYLRWEVRYLQKFASVMSLLIKARFRR